MRCHSVRVRPMYLPAELHSRAECASCRQRPRSKDVWVVHIDRTENDKREIKAQSFLACSEACRDELHSALTVEYSMVGIRHTKTETATDDDDHQLHHHAQDPEAGDQDPVEQDDR